MRPTVTASRLRMICHHLAITMRASLARYSFSSTAASAKHTSTLRKEIVYTPAKFTMAVGSAGSKMARKRDMDTATKAPMAMCAAPRELVAPRKAGSTPSPARRLMSPDTPAGHKR
jgi:hypothetical protein